MMVDLQALLYAVCGQGWATGGGQDTGVYLSLSDRTLRWEPDDSDMNNAAWIVWCLDRLDELMKFPQLATSMVGSHCCFTSYGDLEGQEESHMGKTRAEAVTNALAAALGIDAPGLTQAEPKEEYDDENETHETIGGVDYWQ